MSIPPTKFLFLTGDPVKKINAKTTRKKIEICKGTKAEQARRSSIRRSESPDWVDHGVFPHEDDVDNWEDPIQYLSVVVPVRKAIYNFLAIAPSRVTYGQLEAITVLAQLQRWRQNPTLNITPFSRSSVHEAWNTLLALHSATNSGIVNQIADIFDLNQNVGEAVLLACKILAVMNPKSQTEIPHNDVRGASKAEQDFFGRRKAIYISYFSKNLSLGESLITRARAQMKAASDLQTAEKNKLLKKGIADADANAARAIKKASKASATKTSAKKTKTKKKVNDVDEEKISDDISGKDDNFEENVVPLAEENGDFEEAPPKVVSLTGAIAADSSLAVIGGKEGESVPISQVRDDDLLVVEDVSTGEKTVRRAGDIDPGNDSVSVSTLPKRVSTRPRYSPNRLGTYVNHPTSTKKRANKWANNRPFKEQGHN